MAPKSKGRAVLKKTKKVVEETVQVYIIDDSDKAAEIAMEEGMEFGKDAGGEVTRTTVIIGGDEETEEIGEGREKRVEILIESQNLEEPVLVTPRKEEKKKGAEDQGTRETEKGGRPEAPSDREKERGKVVEEWQEAGEDTGEGGNGVTEEETQDEAPSDREKERGKVVEERQEAGEDTGEGGNGVTEEETRDEAEELESEKGDETREESEEPETEKGDKTGEPEEEEGLVKTPEKKEIGRTGERDGGVVRGGGTKNRKRRRRRGEGTGGGEPEQYKRYVYRVLKQVHPELGISSAAMEVLNAYMNDMFERLADEAAKLSRFTGRKTLSSREVQSAVRLVLPGELGRHAIAEGAKAVTNYMSYGE